MKIIKHYTFTLAWRWGLITSLLIALFWGTWSIFATIPSSDSYMRNFGDVADHIIDILPQYLNRLSRWWDILLGLLISILIVCFRFLIDHDKKTETLYSFIALSPIFILNAAIIYAFVMGILAGIIPGLILLLLVCELGLILMVLFVIGGLLWKLFRKPVVNKPFQVIHNCLKTSALKKWLLVENIGPTKITNPDEEAKNHTQSKKLITANL